MQTPDKSISISDFRNRLSDHLSECVELGRRLVLTNHGENQAIVVSMAEWNSVMETLDVLTDPDLMTQIIDSEQDIRAGRVQSAAEVFSRIGRDIQRGDE